MFKTSSTSRWWAPTNVKLLDRWLLTNTHQAKAETGDLTELGLSSEGGRVLGRPAGKTPIHLWLALCS